MTSEVVEYHVCTGCGIRKHRSAYYKTRQNKRGFVSRCKACVSEYGKKRYRENPDYYIQKANAYIQTHREQFNAASRARYRKNPQRHHESDRKWREKHPLSNKRHIINKNAKKFGVQGRIRTRELEQLWQAQGAVCPLTGLPLVENEAVAQHVIHMAHGGPNTITNVIFVRRQAHHHRQRLTLSDFCEQAGLDYHAVTAQIDAIHRRLRDLHQEVNE